MSGAQPLLANGVARHPEPERFQVYAEPQLTAAPPWQFGVCFHPDCSQEFIPARDWQIYCCSTCERAGVSELRKWGHKMALPLLVWRMGKYERCDEAVMERTRAARRFLTHAQSAWLEDREARRPQAEGAR